MEAEVKELKSRGVLFESYDIPEMNIKTDENDIAVMNGFRTAWFKDSEGNTLNISSYEEKGLPL